MELAFREYGDGRPLIILHGLFGQSDNWNTLARQFGENGFRVFAVDQRNHGRSPHNDTFTYEAMAGDLAGFIKKHSLDRPILVGHSMGAKTVLWFQKAHRGVASALVIVDMAAREYAPHHQAIIGALNSVNLREMNSRTEVDLALKQHIREASTRQFLLKNLHWKNNGLQWRFNLPVITRDYNNVTTGVPFYTDDLPVLVIRGEKSTYINEEDVTDFNRRFSNLRMETITGAGHWVHADQPRVFSERLLTFLKS